MRKLFFFNVSTPPLSIRSTMRTATTTKVWAFVSQKGGVGKSTLAGHAAVWHARRGASVLIIDADAQQSAGVWLAELAHPSITVRTVSDWAQLRATIDNHGADVCIVDGAGGISPTTRAALLAADLVVVPCGASVLDLRAAAQMVDLVAKARQARPSTRLVCRFVLNRVHLHTTIGHEAVEALGGLGEPSCRAVVRQRIALADAPGQARTVFDMSGAQDAADDLEALFSELNRAK